MRVKKEGAFFGDSIEVWGFDEFMYGAFSGLIPVGTGIPAPVIGECENDVWSQDFPPGYYGCAHCQDCLRKFRPPGHTDAPHTI